VQSFLHRFGRPRLPVPGRAADRPAARSTDPTGEHTVYARGVLALANAGRPPTAARSSWSSSTRSLRPNYTIVGSVRPLGLRTLDRIAAGGVAPTPEDPAPVDGAPAVRTEICLAIPL
jgi:peptidyl-prolyl cis-trans isomerase B (cyclophilin B)